MAMVALAFLCIILPLTFTLAAQCQDFHSFTPWLSPSSVCGTILPLNYQVYVENNTCLQAIEQDTATPFPSGWWPLSKDCQIALSKYQCMTAFPGCDNSTITPKYPCQSVCTYIQQKCTGMDAVVLSSNNIFPNCSSSPDCQTIPDPTIVHTPACDNYTGTVCAGVIDYPIYIPAPLTQEYLESQLSAITRVFAIAPRESSCQKHAAAFYCSQAFMKCDTKVVPRALGPAYENLPQVQIPFPRYPCKSTCLDYEASCSGLFGLNPLLVPDCDSYGQAPDARRGCNGSIIYRGQDNFPTNLTIFSNNSGIVFSSQCNAVGITHISAASSIFSDCPFPLVQPEDYNEVDQWVIGSCALPCPIFFSNIEENRKQDLIFTTLSWISVLYFPIVALPYFLFPVKRRHFHVTNFFVAILFLVAAAFSGIFKGPMHGDPRSLDLSLTTTNLRCLNNAQAATIHNSALCGYIGFTNLIGINACSCWYAIIAFDVFSQIVLEKRYDRENSKIRLGFFLYGWIPPVIMTAIGMVHAKIDATGSYTCSGSDINWLWITLFGHPIVNVSIGCIFMLLTFVKVLQVGANVGRIPREAWRLLLLLITFLFMFGFAFIAQGVVTVRYDEVQETATAWLTCLLQNSVNPDPLSICGEAPTVISPHIFRALIVETSISGLLAGLLFTDWNLFELWIYFFSSPNRFSFKKMDRNCSTFSKDFVRKKTKITMTHGTSTLREDNQDPKSKSKSKSGDLAKVDTSLLPDDDRSRRVTDTGIDDSITERGPILFNPFAHDSDPKNRTSSTTATPTPHRRRSIEMSPVSKTSEPSVSSTDEEILSSQDSSSSSPNPQFFALPSVSKIDTNRTNLTHLTPATVIEEETTISEEMESP